MGTEGKYGNTETERKLRHVWTSHPSLNKFKVDFLLFAATKLLIFAAIIVGGDQHRS